MLLFILTHGSFEVCSDLFQYISCYCLSCQMQWLQLVLYISIHLMLLFIFTASDGCFIHKLFQYISCYCLSKCGISVYVPTLDFNTSHVTVYRSILCKSTYPNYISIHLMLLFIREKEQKAEEIYYFNTSHVTVYRGVPALTIFFPKFQYISCYCLSPIDIAADSTVLYFNTSHVTVYLLSKSQYEPALLFQYISCYCLSRRLISIICCFCHFNTSHVTVYLFCIIFFQKTSIFQYISCYCLSKPSVQQQAVQLYFNTSHVTVYQGNHLLQDILFLISIHLMLLFISSWYFKTDTNCLFQYISCYCLSCG